MGVQRRDFPYATAFNLHTAPLVSNHVRLSRFCVYDCLRRDQSRGVRWGPLICRLPSGVCDGKDTYLARRQCLLKPYFPRQSCRPPA
ncbi:hypothetical protein EV1_012369 [Malus domestica]